MSERIVSSFDGDLLGVAPVATVYHNRSMGGKELDGLQRNEELRKCSLNLVGAVGLEPLRRLKRRKLLILEYPTTSQRKAPLHMAGLHGGQSRTSGVNRFRALLMTGMS
jgi:hypothetical protein